MSSINRRESQNTYMKLIKRLFIVTFALMAVSCTTLDPSSAFKPVDVSGVSLDYESITLGNGDSFQLHATVQPANAKNKEVTWKLITGSALLTVKNGLVTANSSGTGTGKVRVSTVESGYSAYCTVKVVAQVIDATSVSLSQNSITVKQGKTVSLVATVSPSNATNKSVSWTSSNTSVATVANGVVTGVKAGGSATITAKTTNGKTASCVVTVDEPVHATSVSLNTSSISVAETRKVSLTATVSPSDAYDKTVTWSSSNTSVATVSNGEVTGVKAGGTATITATTKDGGYTATCTVTVTDKPDADAWTILIYMCGSDLESKNGYATSDLNEILSVPNKPDDVNIIIETGGSTKWKFSGDYSISSSYNQIHRVENNKLVLDYEFTSKPKMGNTSTLQTFIEYGLEKYPAEKTALILWNHGGGLQGVCFGYTTAGNYEDGLYAYEVCDAVSGALANKGMTGQKLEWIGYDACLMQVQDIAEMNSPYFKYMVASEESEAGEGWDYDTWLDDLYSGKDTETILTAIVDGFIADNGGVNSSRNDQTLSYMRLEYADEYLTAWENMALALKSKISSSNKDSFNDLVDTCKHYADSDYEGYGLFDAIDFVNKLSNDSTFNPGSSYTKAVTDAYANFKGYASCGKGAGNSNGLCMFWCINSSYKSDNPYQAGRDTNFTNWAYLSNNYYGSGSSSGGWDWGNWGW